jgi:hypothetical protein
MKLVSSQDEAARERSMHLERLGDIVQRLTAELLRIAAGGGDSTRVAGLLIELGCDPYGPVSAVYVHEKIKAALRCEWDVGIENYSTEEDRQRWRRDGTARREELQDLIQQAAMRVVAARLVGQKAQERRAESALFESVREFGRKPS